MGPFANFSLSAFFSLEAHKRLPLFRAVAEKHEDVSREARDTAGEAPALPIFLA